LCGPVSPDDRSIIGKGPSGPVLYSAEGGTPRLIPQLDPKFNPVRWSNDGLALFGYYPGELPSKVYKIEIATGKQTVIGELRPGAPAGVVMVAPVMVSGDGTRFAYSYNQTLSVLYLVTGLH
jgi:hypothetical protein